MNYKKHYDELIHKAKERSVVNGITEIHHIIPRSEGGSNDKANLVELTLKEHYVAHKLMYMDNPNIMSRVATMWFMSNNRKIRSGRVYEQIRLQFRNDIMGKPKSEEHKKKIQQALIGKVRTEEHIANMKAALPDTHGENNSNFGKGRCVTGDGVEYSNARAAAKAMGTTPQNISYRLKSDSDKWSGWYYTDGDSIREYILSNPTKGRTHSDETKQKISMGRTGIKNQK
tara:strand:- start:44 stop:730 length:687 start_codon:yes stop_codon:yes gene_type:complete